MDRNEPLEPQKETIIKDYRMFLLTCTRLCLLSLPPDLVISALKPSAEHCVCPQLEKRASYNRAVCHTGAYTLRVWPQPCAQLTLHKCGTVVSNRTEHSWLWGFRVKSDDLQLLRQMHQGDRRASGWCSGCERLHMRLSGRRCVDRTFWANNGGFVISNRQSASLFHFFSSFNYK